jgi:hypothetical protein
VRVSPKGVAATAIVALGVAAVLGAEPGKPAAVFEGKDTLLRPAGYREWVFVGSSLGLSYEKGERKGERPDGPEYKNVYIDPTAYRAYKATGKFPQGTVLVLETAAGEEKREPGLKGSYQKEFTGLSAAVKDAERFEGGWGYFQFGGPERPKAKAQPAPKAACFDCHCQKAADDNVFTQFYPVLRAAKP